MTTLTGRIASVVDEVRKHLGGVTRAIASTLEADPHEVLAYRGYGNATRAHVFGRVLEVRNVSASADSDSIFRNLLNTYRRAEADPLAFAEVSVEYRKTSTTMKADDEGFFSGWIELEEFAPTSDEWNEYKVSVVGPAEHRSGATSAKGEILVPPPTSRFGVISDIDDTVIQSRVSNFLQAARTVMLGNAQTRLPFPGVAAFYRALRDGAGDEKNPIYYVSSSPWNIFDVIDEFMRIQDIPRGPVVLRDWDIGWDLLASSRHFEHKSTAIRNIMRLHPEMDFILIGDSSQHDPEIYSQVVAEFPSRVKAIYIRDVTRSADRSASVKKLADEVLAAGSVLILAEDTLAAATHAATQGFISADTLGDIGKEKIADEGRDDTKAPAPDGGEPSSGKPPVVVSGDSSQIGRP